MVIFLNRKACGERAHRKWESIKVDLQNSLGSFKVIECDEDSEFNLMEEYKNCETRFIAAGGDGTVNLLLNILAKNIELAVLRNIKIGAIGIGSSNDYHKPIKNKNCINGIPTKINFTHAKYNDLGKIEWSDDSNTKRVCYWINNASIGITAEANYLFNNPNTILAKLKRISTNQAILYAAIKTIISFKNISLKTKENTSEELNTVVSNLGIVLNPNFSGSFCYDSPYLGNAGKFYIHILNSTSTIKTLRILYNLSKHRFMGLDGTSSISGNNYSVSSYKSFAVEFDGEVIKAKNACFSLINNGVQLCA